MKLGLVLSLFPGIGLLDRAFEEAGFCVVRGPDLLWGGDVRTFDPPLDRFDGVIGGPPCQAHSQMANVARVRWGPDSIAPDLIPEFVRIVEAAWPCWFLMENVPQAPAPVVEGFSVSSEILNNRWLGEAQNRRRRISFAVDRALCNPATPIRLPVQLAALDHPDYEPAVLTGEEVLLPVVRTGTGKGQQTMRRPRPLARAIELQGLPADFLDEAPFTERGKREVVGNGVPLPMGRALAAAVRAVVLERGLWR